MGFNKRKMEDARKTEADEEAASRRELGPQILEDAGRLIADWRQVKRGPVLFSPTIGAASRPSVGFGGYSVRPKRHRPAHAAPSPRRGDHRPHPALSWRSCRPNAPFAELVRLSRLSVLDECNVERGRAPLGE